MSSVLVGAALACVIAAIAGGGLTAFGVQVPIIQSPKRQFLLGIFGVVVLGVVLLSGNNRASSAFAELVCGEPKAASRDVSPGPPAPIGELLTKIQSFNSARAANGGPYEWTQYVEDVATLHRRALDFRDLLNDPQHNQPTYPEVSSIYAALDEAADELSERGLQMHNTTLLQNSTFDRHIFVGPGWFRLYLQNLRRVHENHTRLIDTQVKNFGIDVEYWKACQSGTESGQNCGIAPPFID